MNYRSPLRFLAPIALIAVIVAIFIVVGSQSGGGDEGTKAGTGTELTAQEKKRRRDRRERRAGRTSYTVKAGDSLDAIAIKVRVPKATLQQLNPELDPQALQPGQKIKIR